MNNEIDPMDNIIGQICIVYLEDTSFSARLIAVVRNGNELWFQAKNGFQWSLSRDCVRSIRPISVV